MSYADQGFVAGRSRSVATFDQGGRAAPEDSFSVIDQFSTFDGKFVAERDLRVDGNVKGTIECKGTLFVAQGAAVNARVEAENITVAGELTGDIDCTGRLQLLPSGRLKGKVRTKGLVIAEGALYDGELVMDSGATKQAAADGQPEPEQQTPREAVSPRRAPETARRSSSRAAASQPRSTEAGANAENAAPSTFIRRLGGPETPWEEQSGELTISEPEPEH